MTVATDTGEQTFHLTSGRIALRVVNASGNPAAGVRIEAVQRSGNADLKLTQTDSDGCTRYEHAPRGDYDLFVMRKGFRPEEDAAAYKKARIALGEYVAVPDAAELLIQLPKTAGY